MFLGHSEEIMASFSRLSERHGVAQPIDIAVAFWGSGAERLIRADKRYRIIGNLTAGGTNPRVFRTLSQCPHTTLHHLPALHAKVAVFQHGALVSSANLSSNGLGLEGEDVKGWQEVGYEISAPSADYVGVQRWFEKLWDDSRPVTEELLLAAERAWAKRDSSDPESDDSHPDTARSVPSHSDPTLVESVLFEPFIKPRNKIRMAASWLVDAFAKIEEVSNTSRYVPAYVANIIWTQSGRSIGTNIAEQLIFSKPSDVWARAMKISKKHGPKILTLLSALSHDESTPPAIRYWANVSVQAMSNNALQPTVPASGGHGG